MFGNAAQPGVLRAAGLERARALAITVDDAALAERILKHVQGLGATLPVLVRNAHGRDEQTLIEAGARVFPESMETSLAFTGQLLTLLGFPPSQVEERQFQVFAQYLPQGGEAGTTRPHAAISRCSLGCNHRHRLQKTRREAFECGFDGTFKPGLVEFRRQGHRDPLTVTFQQHGKPERIGIQKPGDHGPETVLAGQVFGDLSSPGFGVDDFAFELTGEFQLQAGKHLFQVIPQAVQGFW